MESGERTVAIVGRPNVGKSRLFNRLAGKRIAIVHDQPGVTRDVISAEVEGQFLLLDTGGLGLSGPEGSESQLIDASEQQVGFAIETAQLILLVVDGKQGRTPLDQRIAEMLRRSGKDVLLVVNKADFTPENVDLSDFYSLGLGEPALVSAEHGTGEEELRAIIRERLGPVPEAPEAQPEETKADEPLRFCFAGRPNVGKSSLANRLLNSDRLVVSATPGTTRDAVELDCSYKLRDGRAFQFRLIDTAGIKSEGKVGSPVEYFSRVRSLDAIHRADVVFLVLDAMDGVTQQDKAIAGQILEQAHPMVVVVNKWDLVHEAFRAEPLPGFEDERDFRERFENALFRQLFFTPGSPVVFVSAKEGFAIDRILKAAAKIDRTLSTRLPTGRLNQVLIRLAERKPPPMVQGRRFRVYYAVQTGNRPFRIRIFCNQPRRLEDSYRRYLESGLVREFALDGCPIRFDLVGKERFSSRSPGGGEGKPKDEVE